jgi:hypothetical protein
MSTCRMRGRQGTASTGVAVTATAAASAKGEPLCIQWEGTSGASPRELLYKKGRGWLHIRERQYVYGCCMNSLGTCQNWLWKQAANAG